jgi:histidinol-phosphate aminotransferase
MNYADLANAGVSDLPMYVPGKPIADVASEYGLPVEHVAKLASNENPFGPSPLAMEAVRECIGSMHLYPDGGACALRRAIADLRGVGEDAVMVGNGSNELIELMGHAFLRPGLEVVMGAQAFIVYKLVTRLFGATAVEVPMRDFGHDLEAMRRAITDRTRMVFVASPNNPTGIANDGDALLAFAKSLPEHVIFCFDEAYAEYLEAAPDLCEAILAGHKVVCLRTFSKIYGLGGLRVGYAYGDRDLIALLERVRQPFNVNLIGQAAALAALEDVEFLEKCRGANNQGREQLSAGLRDLGFETWGGQANFVLTRVSDGARYFEALQKRGLIVRPLGGYGMHDFLRITIGRQDENERLLAEMGLLLSGDAKRKVG